MRFSLKAAILGALAFTPSAQSLRVLLTNDDGWASANLREFYRLLKGDGHDVVLVAPVVDNSGQGGRVGRTLRTAITFLLMHPSLGRFYELCQSHQQRRMELSPRWCTCLRQRPCRLSHLVLQWNPRSLCLRCPRLCYPQALGRQDSRHSAVRPQCRSKLGLFPIHALGNYGRNLFGHRTRPPRHCFLRLLQWRPKILQMGQPDHCRRVERSCYNQC